MTKRTLIVLLVLVAVTIASPAQTFKPLVKLNASGNISLQGIDGNLYGTAGDSIFRMTPRGWQTTLYDFCATANCADGSSPGPLVQGINSSLYGITTTGGAYGYGTVFQFTPTGELKTLHSFCDPSTCDDGYGATVLVLATNGNFYGLTTTAAAGCVWPDEGGALFEVSPAGKFTVIAPLCYQDATAPVLFAQGVNGAFFASEWSFLIEHSFVASGGFYEINPQGNIVGGGEFCVDEKCDTTVHPVSAVEAANGDFWGTWKGHISGGGIFKFKEAGGFKPASTYSGAVFTVLGSDGHIYGANGDGAGSVIEFTPYPASVREIYSFPNGSGGPPAIQDTNGDFYGSTPTVIYRLSTGLAPFVSTLPSAGRPGSVVFIKGTAISGATELTFGGVPANFVKGSPSALKATVPEGLRGPVTVEVTLPSGKLQGNAPFRVLP